MLASWIWLGSPFDAMHGYPPPPPPPPPTLGMHWKQCLLGRHTLVQMLPYAQASQRHNAHQLCWVSCRWTSEGAPSCRARPRARGRRTRLRSQ